MKIDPDKIHVKHRSYSPEKLAKKFAGWDVLDLSSKGQDPWVKFSPFYPHGGVPVPFTQDGIAQSVEGIWQGLKVFETADIDTKRFEITSMKGLKRTVRRFGTCLGHRKGTQSTELLDYREARYEIYLPSYLWVLENKLSEEVAALRQRAEQGPLILLDYELNCDVDNLKRPLSHAGLVMHYLLGQWPVK